MTRAEAPRQPSTAGAAAYFTLPNCVACIVQAPTLASVTVDPFTEHIVPVSEVKLTGSPDVAVAVTVNDPLP